MRQKKTKAGIGLHQLFNSRDIAEYLDKIDYEPSPLALAYLIRVSKRLSIAEKHRAWENLIANTENFMLPDRVCCLMDTYAELDFHTFLRRHIKLEDRLLAAFYTPAPDAVYFYSAYDSEGDFWQDSKDFYATFADCRLDLERWHKETIVHANVYKKQICKTGQTGHSEEIRANLASGFKTITDIGLREEGTLFHPEEWDIWCGFENMRFDIPTPFRRGDILCRHDCPDIPFVLDSICYEHMDEKARAKERRNGDFSDMSAWIFVQISRAAAIGRRSTGLTCDTYLELEYYRGTLHESNRILGVLSDFMKGKIDSSFFLQACGNIVREYQRERADGDLWLSEEGLKAIGLLPDDKKQ